MYLTGMTTSKSRNVAENISISHHRTRHSVNYVLIAKWLPKDLRTRYPALSIVVQSDWLYQRCHHCGITLENSFIGSCDIDRVRQISRHVIAERVVHWRILLEFLIYSLRLICKAHDIYSAKDESSQASVLTDHTMLRIFNHFLMLLERAAKLRFVRRLQRGQIRGDMH